MLYGTDSTDEDDWWGSGSGSSKEAMYMVGVDIHKYSDKAGIWDVKEWYVCSVGNGSG